MKTEPIGVTSVSGGRTSSYLSLHYPTDINIFSLVRIEDKRCAPKDISIIKYVEDKIQMDFIATAESDLTLCVLRQLEQDLGKSITWVTGRTFEQLIYDERRINPRLPNRRMRFCTELLKMYPIFWHIFLHVFKSVDDYVTMNIGYRADEPRRNATDEYKYSMYCNTYGEKQNNWNTIEWRDSKFPLRENGINNLMIKSYFAKHPEYVFPEESNCVGCFNKSEPVLQKQFDYEPEKMNWFNEMEQATGLRFNISDTLDNIMIKDFSTSQMDMFDNAVTCNCTD